MIQLLPAEWRIQLRIALKTLRDMRSGYIFKFAYRKSNDRNFPYTICLSQPVMPGNYFENKVHNIKTGASSIDSVIIKPGEVFSFWRLVKRPTAENNYRQGRNIVGGKVVAEYGGGLCQLSSIIYHTTLLSGLQIIERHHHSVDIYKEEERFTPLGADATVVYGYKDLRVKNNYAFPVQLTFSLEEATLTCFLHSTEEIQSREISFERVYLNNTVEVSTIHTEKTGIQILSKDVYKLPEV